MALSQSDEQDPRSKVLKAKAAIEAGDFAAGMNYASEALDIDPHCSPALAAVAYVLMQTGRNGPAYHLYMKCAEMDPDRSGPLNNAGMALANNFHFDEAEEIYKAAYRLSPNDKAVLQNVALLYLNKAQPKKALEWVKKAEETGEATWQSLDTKALANLALGNWEEGWKNYRETAGMHKQRPIWTYQNEPMWNGEPGTVVLYGNQGLGDEIAFASCIPDAMKRAEVIIDCDKRLEGLFRRSFGCKVYGTRFQETRDWEHAIDYSLPFDCLPSIFRNKREDFPQKAYLVADPERLIQWKSLFRCYKKPVIGIAWTGGVVNTGRASRSLTLEQLLPIFRSIDATWVSLEYKDRSEDIKDLKRIYGIEVLDFPRALRTPDYDDTVGMVAALDLVISVTTTVVHLCDAISKECWCLVPKRPRFFFGVEGNDYPWSKTTRLFRQKEDWPIEEIASELKLRYGPLRDAS